MQFKSKPTTVEAVLAKEAIRASGTAWEEIPPWLRAAYDKGGVVFTSQGVHLPTPQGSVKARPEDWIVCGPNGEPYPLTQEQFAAMFETA